MTRRDVQKLAKKHGIEISEDADMGRLFADAPLGKVFAGSGTHCVVADWGEDWGNNPKAKAEAKAEAWADLGERLDYSTVIEDCDTVDCDVCSEAS